MVKRYVPRDTYARRAAEQGYLARSAFKLERIDERFGVLRPGFRVLDLGAAPGSWLQVASKSVGPRGLVVGVDLTPVSFSAPNVVSLPADILRNDFPSLILPYAPFDTVLSDAAPNCVEALSAHDVAQARERHRSDQGNNHEDHHQFDQRYGAPPSEAPRVAKRGISVRISLWSPIATTPFAR